MSEGKKSLIEQLEGYRVIVTDPEDYTPEELRQMLLRVKAKRLMSDDQVKDIAPSAFEREES